MTPRVLGGVVHVYPTMAEALKIAALSLFKDVEKAVLLRGMRTGRTAYGSMRSSTCLNTGIGWAPTST